MSQDDGNAGSALSRDAIVAQAARLGIDSVGFCEWQRLEELAPEYDRPSQISTYLETLVVLVKRYPTGVACSPDAAYRQYATGRVARHLEEAAAELAYWLEGHDAMACLLSAQIPDLRRQPVTHAGPGGQGSLLLRRAGAACGLGTLGLNHMLLTPSFGPRVFLAGVLTDLHCEPGVPLGEELCSGLEQCGRCAAICPQDAIPRRAPQGASLHEVRDLDEVACARSCHPHGPDRMVEQLGALFRCDSPEQAASLAKSRLTQQIWFDLAVQRQGVFTGCQVCELVCPVGEDYVHLERSKVRGRDLPRDFAPQITDGFVRIE